MDGASGVENAWASKPGVASGHRFHPCLDGAARHPREPARGRGRQGPCHEQRPRLHAGDRRRPAPTPAAGAIGPPSRACPEARAPDRNEPQPASRRHPHDSWKLMYLRPFLGVRIRCRRGAVRVSLDTGQNSCRSAARVVDAEQPQALPVHRPPRNAGPPAVHQPRRGDALARADDVRGTRGQRPPVRLLAPRPRHDDAGPDAELVGSRATGGFALASRPTLCGSAPAASRPRARRAG